MKVSNIKAFTLSAMLLSAPILLSANTYRLPETKPDTFELSVTSPEGNKTKATKPTTKKTTTKKTTTVKQLIQPGGTTSPKILNSAPSPAITIAGKSRNARLVVDIGKNILYRYDAEGKPEKAFLIASGKPSTPTDTGLRIVKYIAHYPYNTEPRGSKRFNYRDDYGDHILILNKVNPKNGAESSTGEFIHGNNKKKKWHRTIGQYVSHGCMRMYNEDIVEMSTVIKRGDIVNIIDSRVKNKK